MILTNTNLDFSYWAIIIGGLGLFLFGISFMSTSIKRIAGDKLKKIITKCTNNKFLGILVGAGFTGVIQSSSATTALTIGLVRAGVMTLVQAVAIIIGANIGTTITAFIISIPFTEYFSLFVFVGAFILLLCTRRKFRNIGDLLFSFGCIFFGLVLMENLKDLAAEPLFIDMFENLNNLPWLGLLIGTLAATVLQSSSAVIGIMQGLYAAGGGIMSLFGIIPIILGANVGTTSTSLIASIGGCKESKRLAIIHVFFNVFGALLFMILLYCFKFWLGDINNFGYSPSGSSTSGDWVFYLDPMLQIAFVHLVFNVVMTIIIYPFINSLCKLVTKIIPNKGDEKKPIEIKELNNKVMKDFPSTGLYIAKEQILQEFSLVIEQFESIGKYIIKPEQNEGEYIHSLEDSIDKIDRQLNIFLLSADKGLLSEEEFKNYSELLRAGKDVERMGDYGDNLINYFETLSERKETLNKDVSDLLRDINTKAIALIKNTCDIYKVKDIKKADEISKIRREYNERIEGLITEHFNKTLDLKSSGTPKFIDLVYTDIMNAYSRIYSHCANIAKLYLVNKKPEVEKNK